MDTPHHGPAPVPPQIPMHTAPRTVAALGENPEDREPVTNPAMAIEAVLRQPRRVLFQLRQPGAGLLIGAMLLIAILCSLVYGVVVGSFSMHEQLWAAPLKIAGGLLLAAIICLPSLYIFTCLSGSRARLGEVVGFVCGLLMLMTILLIGFAPIAWLFSQSTQSEAWMGALHLVFWVIATLFGVRFLQSGFSHSQARSNAGIHTWVIIFVLVILQMTTALRPLIGRSDTLLPQEKKFFVAHWAECLKLDASSTR